jgi:hypothetical protein
MNNKQEDEEVDIKHILKVQQQIYRILGNLSLNGMFFISILL